jgi:hypothetical protein
MRNNDGTSVFENTVHLGYEFAFFSSIHSFSPIDGLLTREIHRFAFAVFFIPKDKSNDARGSRPLGVPLKNAAQGSLSFKPNKLQAKGQNRSILTSSVQAIHLRQATRSLGQETGKGIPSPVFPAFPISEKARNSKEGSDLNSRLQVSIHASNADAGSTFRPGPMVEDTATF